MSGKSVAFEKPCRQNDSPLCQFGGRLDQTPHEPIQNTCLSQNRRRSATATKYPPRRLEQAAVVSRQMSDQLI